MTDRDFDRNGIPSSSEHQVHHSRRFSNDLIEKARKVFQKRTSRNLTNEDARQMLENLTGFFVVLHEWNGEQGRHDADPTDKQSDDSDVLH